MNCPDGSSTCPTGSADCYGPHARLCGRPEYEEVVRRQTARREAAREAGTPFAVATPMDGAGPPPPRADYCAAPYRSRDEFVVPVRLDRHGELIPWPCKPWEGAAPRKPWDYPIVAAIVHNDQVEMLKVVIETLRAQTMRPFIHVVDTGSTEANRAVLRELELSCDDVQIDYLNPRGWTMTSFPVAVAMDLVFASLPPEIEYVYSTHVDVYLKSPRYLEYLAGRCDEWTPAIGYQMSDRERWGTDLWKIIPSHTATLYHMPTMRRIGASWSMTRAIERLGIVDYEVSSFPDTEVNLGLDLRDAGIGIRWLAADGSDPDKPAATYAPKARVGRLVDVGDDVWVGNWECCATHSPDFPLSIHFRYASRSGPMCDRVTSGEGLGLEVVYSDGDSLATLSVPLAELMAYCRRPGRILIHCAAGQTRSPTMAILAKMARGRDRFEAIAEVTKAVWDEYRVGIGLHPRPLTEILEWKDDGVVQPPRARPSWLCLGPEPNEPYETPWLVHERSYTAHAIYAPALADQRHAKVRRSMAEALERVEAWKLAASTPPGWPACRHRSLKWRCNQEMAAECAMGKGQAGIVDEADCLTCPHKEGS